MSTPEEDTVLNIKERIGARCWPHGAIATCANPLCDEKQFLSPSEVIKCLDSGWPRCHEASMQIEARGPLI